MARLALSWRACLFIFSVTLATVNNPALSLVHAAKKSPTRLSFYVHANFLSTNSFVTDVLGVNGSNTALGTLTVFDFVLREDLPADSPVIGEAGGQTTAMRDTSIYVDLFFLFDTPSGYKGTLLGQIKGTNAFGEGEGVISGGTEDFRWARGYFDLQVVAGTAADLAKVVYTAELYLRYD